MTLSPNLVKCDCVYITTTTKTSEMGISIENTIGLIISTVVLIINKEIFNAGKIDANPPRPEIDEDTQTNLESFTRTATGGAFVVSNISFPLPDLYPPSQITDLEATPDGDMISLTWTAPGDDFDVGKGKDEMSWGVN